MHPPRDLFTWTSPGFRLTGPMPAGGPESTSAGAPQPFASRGSPAAGRVGEAGLLFQCSHGCRREKTWLCVPHACYRRAARHPAPSAALTQEWGPAQPSAYDPLHGLADWSAPTVWSKYDPLVRAIRSTARPGSSKYDPLDARSRAPRSQPAFFAASAATAGPDKYDAVGCMLAAAAASFGGRATSGQGPQRYDAAGQLLRASLQHTLPEARSVRYDPIDWLRSGWAGGPEVPAAPRGAARYDPVSGLGSVTAPRHATKYDPARELLSGDWLDAATRGFDAAASRLGLIPEAATNEGRASMEGSAEALDVVARDAADPSIWSPKTPALSSL